MIDARTTLIRDLVTEDFRTASVFGRHGLDFCCGGGRPISEACEAKGIDTDALVAELEAATATPDTSSPRFDAWELDMLADYIVANHHRYINDVLPVIYMHIRKVAKVHGAYHPETVAIAEAFTAVGTELMQHMRKEELVLFPYIRSLVAARRDDSPVAGAPFGSVASPIRAMEREHEQAGSEMATISDLSSGYTPPEDACTTYRVAYQELRAFELDLHRHVHLENNILFPKAIALEQELLAAV